MALTADDVAKRVRSIYGDKNKNQLDDTDLCLWITDAQRRLVRRYKPVSSTLLVSVSGQSIYTWAGGFISISDAFYDSTQIKSTTREQLDALDPYWLGNAATPSGTPQLYWVEGGQLRLYPTPDTDGKQISVTSVVLPGIVDDLTDPLVIDDAFLETLVERVLTRAREFDEDYSGASYHKQEAEKLSAEDATEEATRGNNSYPVIRDDLGDYW